MYRQITIDTSLSGRLKDMWKAYEAGAYLSALSLAVTFPDVCSNLDKDQVTKSTGTRYVKWFDEYVAPLFGPIKDVGHEYANPYEDPHSSRVNCYFSTLPGEWQQIDSARNWFNGAACYAIRCKLLHEGIGDLTGGHNNNYYYMEQESMQNANGRADNNDMSKRCAYHGIVFIIGGCGGTASRWNGCRQKKEDPKALDYVQLELKDYLQKMDEGVRDFLSRHPDADDALAERIDGWPLISALVTDQQSGIH